MPVPLSVFTIENVAKWLMDARRLSGVTAMALDSIYGTGYLESRLTEACQAAEGLHRRCFAQTRRIPADDAKDLRQKIKEIAKPEHRSAITDLLAALGDPSLRMRLTELIGATDGALSDLVPEEDQWAKSVKDARNQLAHQLFGDSNDVENATTEDRPDFRRMMYLTQSTAFCALAYLLRRCGVSGEALRFGFQRMPGFREMVAYAADQTGDT
jgi:hypothetical protein